MPHLIDSEDEIYIEEPVNEDLATERINDRMTYSSQSYSDLQEKTLPELIRMPLKKNIDPIGQGQQELAGSQLVDKAAVELTFDEIARAYSEEEDPRSVFGPVGVDQVRL
jgi:hypothetical protein